MKPKTRQPVPEPPPGDVRLAVRLLLPLGIVALVWLIYNNALHNPFVIDALPTIVTQPDVVEPEGLSRLWTHDFWGDAEGSVILYRPITVLTYHLNARWLGLNSYTFRVVNVLLLASLGCLAARWLARYVRRTVAWLAAAILVAHPANTELINHIVGRADLLSMIGVVGLLHAQRRTLELGRWTPIRALTAVFFLILAVGSKEFGLLVLPAMALQYWVFHRDDRAVMPHPHRNVRILRTAAILTPLAIFVAARVYVLGWSISVVNAPDPSANPLRGMDWLQRLPAAIATAWLYARQVVWTDTSFTLTPATMPGWESPATILGLLTLTVLLACLIAAIRRRNWLSIPLLLALGQYVAVGNLIAPAGAYAVNRFMLPFIFLAVCGVAAWFNKITRGSVRRRAVAVIPCGAAVILMGWVVMHVNPQWASQADRFRADLAAHPDNPAVLYQLGETLLGDDRSSEAITVLEPLVVQMPQSTQARLKLGQAYLQAGDLTRAADQYRLVIKQHPHDLGTQLTLADLCLRQGKPDEADDHIRQAAAIAPQDIRVTYAQAELAVAQGQRGEAMRLYRAVLLRSPDYPLVRQKLEELAEQMKQP